MAHSVIITTPMPTLDEIGKRLGLSKADQRFVNSLFEKKNPQRTARFRASAKAGIRKSTGVTRKTKSSARKSA
jgi:hypothetical protein